jgi:hypothetical protein
MSNMTDLLLAVEVIGAIIAFGALISVGNERQRRAIEALHQAYKQWAVQDLRLKRGTVSSQTQIQDLTAWLTRATSLALGRTTNVMDYQLHLTPVPTIEFHDAELGTTIIGTLESPQVLLSMLKKKSSFFHSDLRTNPIFHVSRKTPAIELSMLNAGALFDVELPIVWNTLTGQSTDAETLWVYILS